MSTALNLARKWRPRTFQDVVGQPLAVNMLRNSLYKNHFFPVYLFAGQKGCGKTSTARILAAAANCSVLALFQKAPEAHPLPCLICPSCLHMQSGTHPDFIEIDAASHTGVDDVRMLLESCSFLPLVGTKKIYLIDEAHMLSKAAFNAFLKILEEPPAHTLFMLATTEMLKIPDTVRSRCFQLHFSGLPTTELTQHLARVCEQEQVAATEEALTLIVRETEGSARDALNILEQVRFSTHLITADTVRTTLGIMSIDRLAQLVLIMLTQNVSGLLEELNLLASMHLNPQRTWHLLLQTIRTLLWYSYTVTPLNDSLALTADLRLRILETTSPQTLQKILNYLWHQEELFLQTPYKQAFLEKIYVDIATGLYETTAPAPVSAQQKPVQKVAPQSAARPEVAKPAPNVSPRQLAEPLHAPEPQSQPAAPSTAWSEFCRALTALNDPILSSIINQARLIQADTTTGILTIALAHASPFFKEKIHESHAHWRPLLAQYFTGCSTIEIIATKESAHPAPSTPRQPEKAVALPPKQPAPQQAPQTKQSFYKNGYAQKQKTPRISESLTPGTPLILNDDNKAQWPYTSLLYGLFPGKVEVIASPSKS
jgi:DNA polymerase-3 subunit gamma/tau